MKASFNVKLADGRIIMVRSHTKGEVPAVVERTLMVPRSSIHHYWLVDSPNRKPVRQ